jgi:hypothetical protein
LCQDVTATAAGDVRATARRCVTAVESPLPSEPQPKPQEPEAKPAEQPPAEPKPQEPRPLPAETPPAAPKLVVTKKGPDRRRVGEMALFVIEVTNAGQTPLEQLRIADNFETSLEPARATEGSEWFEGNALGWRIESLAAGRSVRREIELRCLRPTPRSCNRVTVTARGVEAVADEACLEIVDEEAPAPPAAAPELSVSVADTADPIKLDGQTTCQIVVSNKTDRSAFDVEVTVQFSDQLRLDGIFGPVQGSVSAGTVRFTPVREVRAGESPSFELRFKGAQAGTGRVQVSVTSRGQAKPMTAEQTTEVLR